MKSFISVVVTIVITCSILMGAVCAGSEPTAKFNDVKESDWFAEAVAKMYTMKIIDGLPGGSFNPKGEVTRAQFVKMLVQAMGYKKIDSVSFNDLKPFPTSKPHWASVYIETALRNGVIVKSEIGENFFPDVPLTRKDMGMMMFRALKLNFSEGENPFIDLTEANGYITKLYEEYLIRGTIEGGKRLYKPEGLTTRAEAAVIIARMVEYRENPQTFKDKMKKQENLHAATANGVPLRLYEYMDGTDGRTFKECYNEYYNFIRYRGVCYAKTNGYIYPEIATYGGSDAFLKYQYDVVKQYMKATYNIDYRTVADTYKKNIGDSMGRGLFITLDNNIAKWQKYKVVCKSEFITDFDLIYLPAQGETIRGTLRIKYDSPTSPEYAEKLGVEVGKWYDIDVNVRLSRASVSEYWYVNGDMSVDYLADPILLNK